MDPKIQLPEFDHPPERVVSLVPSITESMFTLGLGDRLVGVTDFCAHPEEQTSLLPKVGGTKNASFSAIMELKPDLVIANQEENTAETITALEAAGITVWLTFPKTVDDSVDVLYGIAGLFRDQRALLAVKSLATAVDYAQAAAAETRVQYFCPIWFDRLSDGTPWWMTFNQDTYPHDLLLLLGGENVFSGRERLYPLEADLGRGDAVRMEDRDVRYPRVTKEELQAASPSLVLLPSEPYAFSEEDAELLKTVLGEGVKIVFVEGSLLTWHGTRLAQALRMNLLTL